jgi:putative nucleotidyltransferase with HDIG domain
MRFTKQPDQLPFEKTCRCAVKLAASPRAAEEAFTAGMLHDVGKVFLATHVPSEFAASLERASANHEPLIAVEKAMFGASHAELGAYLLGIWGLPQSIVDAVAAHHALDAPSEDLNDASVLVRLAVMLSCRTAPRGSPTENGDEVGASHGLGARDMPSKWLEMAANLALDLARNEGPA